MLKTLDLEELSRTGGVLIVHPTIGPVYIEQDIEYSATFHLTPVYGMVAPLELSKSALDIIDFQIFRREIDD